ncbi:cytochrome P450 [Neorhizobium galegae]|uniref:cytochrome P450 n=1 Tax=Neorhizobium galegae TaxID=399 RepID=UPI0012810236|nr:cytochrome P450 [Neorhizobium galegae]KAA9384101.1 cytochrome P450 [Neorhizobium galegae]MCM2498750.1 cytochrome P450 [Neorhizobium galegae]
MSVTSKPGSAGVCPFHAGGKPPPFETLREHPLNPPEQLKLLRQKRGPSKVTLWDGSEAWIATHYEDVREVLGDPRFSTVTTRPGYPFVSRQRRDVLINGRPNFTFFDPPDHTRFRRMLARLFTVERFAQMRPFVQQIVDDLIDSMEKNGAPAPFVENFALEVPVRVLAHLVGIPKEGQELFLQAGKDRFDLGGDPTLSHNSGEALWSYLDNLLAEHERNPGDGDDVITRLVVDQVKPGKFTRDEAILIINQLLVAGFDTTAATIAIGALALLENPEQLAKLKADPSKVENAVHEILRYATILQFHSSRAAKEDVEIGGELIKAGEGVIALLHAANRDPDEFANPDKFDIDRDAAHHVAFSYGIHQCLGQSLARLELQVVFGTLIRRLPNLRLAQRFQDIEFAKHSLAYGPQEFLVAW